MSMSDAMQRLFADATRKLSAELPDGHVVNTDPTSLNVIRHSGFITVSDGQLMDLGVIPDTRPPVHIPWQARLRWCWSAWRERVGRKVGGWIAGVDLSERDDDW